MTSEGPGDDEKDLDAGAIPAHDQADVDEESDIFQSKGSASITSSITGYQYENGQVQHVVPAIPVPYPVSFRIALVLFDVGGESKLISAHTRRRRYHAYSEGAYYLPNDEAEQARLDLVHHVFRLALGKC